MEQTFRTFEWPFQTFERAFRCLEQRNQGVSLLFYRISFSNFWGKSTGFAFAPKSPQIGKIRNGIPQNRYFGFPPKKGKNGLEYEVKEIPLRQFMVRDTPTRRVSTIKRESGENPGQTRCCKSRKCPWRTWPLELLLWEGIQGWDKSEDLP